MNYCKHWLTLLFYIDEFVFQRAHNNIMDVFRVGDAGRHLLHADDTDGRQMTELHLIIHTAVYTAGGNYACRH